MHQHKVNTKPFVTIKFAKEFSIANKEYFEVINSNPFFIPNKNSFKGRFPIIPNNIYLVLILSSFADKEYSKILFPN